MANAIVTAMRTNMRRALNAGHLREAEEILNRLKQEDPLSQVTRGFELELSLNSNRLAEANSLARQLCRLFPDSARIAFLAGKVAYRLKNYKGAESHFRESLRIHAHWRTEYWLGKALTQSGNLDKAEPLLLAAREHTAQALLDLAWLYERKAYLEEAVKAYDEFLAIHPGHSFAVEQRLRIRARMLEPESLIEEAGMLSDLGEDLPVTVFPEYVEKLFDRGNTVEARQRIVANLPKLDAKAGTQVAWVCYRAKAYDLACSLFLGHLQHNLSYYKYLNALESAAAKSGRIPQVVEAYRVHAAEVPSLHGRLRKLARKSKPSNAHSKKE